MIKRIISQEDRERKKRRNQFIVGGVLAVLMIMSTVGFALFSGEEENTTSKITYNNLVFYKTLNGWQTTINGRNFEFQNNPLEVQDIRITNVSLEDYYNKALFIDSQDASATYEIYYNLNGIASRIQNACLEEENCSSELPVKTCNDSVIVIETLNTTSIEKRENCLIIKAKEGEAIKVVDAFLYKIFGI